MIDDKRKQQYYEALVAKDSEYEGLFYVGVKTTGVFCRPTCPARKPKMENCEFYESAQQALLAAYRPCRRCRPLTHPNQVSDVIRLLVEAVENNPEKRWRSEDFKRLSVDESTARRQFKKRFGMTFVEYARARRMGIALKNMTSGEAVIDAKLSYGISWRQFRAVKRYLIRLWRFHLANLTLTGPWRKQMEPINWPLSFHVIE